MVNRTPGIAHKFIDPIDLSRYPAHADNPCPEGDRFPRDLAEELATQRLTKVPVYDRFTNRLTEELLDKLRAKGLDGLYRGNLSVYSSQLGSYYPKTSQGETHRVLPVGNVFYSFSPCKNLSLGVNIYDPNQAPLFAVIKSKDGAMRLEELPKEFSFLRSCDEPSPFDVLEGRLKQDEQDEQNHREAAGAYFDSLHTKGDQLMHYVVPVVFERSPSNSGKIQEEGKRTVQYVVFKHDSEFALSAMGLRGDEEVNSYTGPIPYSCRHFFND